MEPEAAGKVIGEKKVKPKQRQMATIGLVGVLIVIIAAIVILKLYTRPMPQPEVVSKEKRQPQPEKPSTLPPATEVAPKERKPPPSA